MITGWENGGRLVMVAALQNDDVFPVDAVDEAVLPVDAAGVAAGKIVLQRFGAADAGEGRLHDALQQGLDTFRFRRIGAVPECDVGDGLIRQEDIHSRPSSSSVTRRVLPEAASSSDARSALALPGEPSRYAVSMIEE